MRQLVAIGAIVLIPVVAATEQAALLKIVVLEGEGAVNIIQQNTAVRPMVEVRDRNNLPVAGASVTFTIGGGGQAAFAGGAQTLTVTTNAAGQAAASSFSAVSSGTVQIQVQAVYQGQIASAAISQTNFATAAAAAQAGAGAGGGSGATATGGAAGGGAGGGISATTIGIIGGAVAGGAVAATQLSGQQEDSDFVDSYNGTVNGQIQVNSVQTRVDLPPNNCTFTRTITGSVHVDLKADGTGDANLDLTITPVSLTGNCILDTTPRPLGTRDLPVTGGPSAITFTYNYTDTVSADTWRFTGSLSGNTITGSLTYQVAPPPAGANPSYNGSTTMPVTLTGPRR